MKKTLCTAILGILGAVTCSASEGALSELQLAVPQALASDLSVPPAPAAKSLSFLSDRNLNAAQLTELLRDPNPEVRKAAVRSAQNYILNTYALHPVLSIYKNKGERTDIRVEAARTLSYATARPEALNALADLLSDAGEPSELRVMSYKAMHRAASDNTRVQEYLMAAAGRLEKDPAARHAAVWALFESSKRTAVKDFLAGLASSREEESLRLEAVKSLYGAQTYPNVKNLFKTLASDENETKQLRIAAIKALSGARDSSVDRFILEIIRTERDQEIRAAAVAAAEPSQAELNEFFHLGHTLQDGSHLCPIEKE